MVKKEDKINLILDNFYQIIKEKYPVKKILLYGSYAKGSETEDSDIDVGVVIDLPDHTRRLEIVADLFHYSRQADSLIEPRCIFLDEYYNHDKASILAEIIRTAKEIQLAN